MARRKNSAVTLLMFVGVIAFGWAAYHFLYEDNVFAKADASAPAGDQITGLKSSIESALSGDGCFQGITAVNWRPNAGRYRIDVQMADGCTKGDGQRLASRVAELVQRATDGKDTEVWTYILGREVYHRLP